MKMSTLAEETKRNYEGFPKHLRQLLNKWPTNGWC